MGRASARLHKVGDGPDRPRLLGPRGNPQARNLFGIIGYLQKQAGLELHVTPGLAETGARKPRGGPPRTLSANGANPQQSGHRAIVRNQGVANISRQTSPLPAIDHTIGVKLKYPPRPTVHDVFDLFRV